MGMDPATIMLAATAAQAVGGAVGGMQQNKSAKQQANAVMADNWQRASDEINNAQQYSQKQEVGFITSGVDLSGSPLLVMQNTLKRGQQNAQNIMNSGTAQASTLRMKGQQALSQGIVSAFGDVAKGYDSYEAYKLQYGKPADTAKNNGFGTKVPGVQYDAVSGGPVYA